MVDAFCCFAATWNLQSCKQSQPLCLDRSLSSLSPSLSPPSIAPSCFSSRITLSTSIFSPFLVIYQRCRSLPLSRLPFPPLSVYASLFLHFPSSACFSTSLDIIYFKCRASCLLWQLHTGIGQGHRDGSSEQANKWRDNEGQTDVLSFKEGIMLISPEIFKKKNWSQIAPEVLVSPASGHVM